MKLTKFLLFCSIVLFLINPNPVSSEQENTVSGMEINSKNILEYIKGQKYFNEIKTICSENFCKEIDLTNLTHSLENFIEKYELEVLKSSGEEKAFEVKLKGFPITKINLSRE